MTHDSDATLRFLRHLWQPDDCLEARVIGADFARGNYIVAGQRYSKILAGWYDSPDALAVDAGRLRGVSGYVIANPVIPDMLACSANTLKVSKSTTRDEHIRCIRWLYLDFDANKPAADMSATQAELSTALAKRNAVLERFPDLAASAVWGCSGNGGWLLVRLPDYVNDDEHRALIARTVDHFADHHGADRKTKNPARLMPLVGTIKCKGSNVPDRPWRLVTMDSPDLPEGRTFDLKAFVADHVPDTPPSKAATATAGVSTSVPWSTAAGSSQGTPGAPSSLSDDYQRIYRAARYLDGLAPAVSGQGGHDQTFDAACALVVDFGLTKEQARPILATWNQRCEPPWSPAELEHKLDDADARPGPRGRLYESHKPDFVQNGRSGVPGASVPAVPAPPLGGVPANGEPPADLPPGHPGIPEPGDGDPLPPVGHEDNPHRIANWFLRECHNHPDGYTLRFWQDEFHQWIRGAYHPVSNKEIRGEVASWTHKDFERIYIAQMIAAAMAEDKKPPKPIPVTTNLTGHVVQAMSGIVQLKAAQYPSQPCWLDGEDGWAVPDVLPMRNAIVHIPSYLAGQPCTRQPTPRLFTAHVLGYDWQPDAPAPSRWLEFLKGIWPDDQQSIDALQEWFGLQLVPVTRHQKMFAFIGPPRAGKGVIASVMRAMVGPENCCGPTLSGLAETFGMQSLIGKLSAIIDDARLSGRSDHAVITERLLSISGEGTLDVRRMHRSQWTGVLSCRITLISNELPRLNDNSNALTNRFIILKFTQSHLGREDNTLKDQFMKELPGIVLWAIEGLRRLNDRGHFVQPESGQEIHEEMEDMASPIGSFVRDCCIVDQDETCTKDEAYLAWRQWCERNGRKEPGELNVFARNLRSVVPGMIARRLSKGGRQERVFKGVGLLPPESLVGSSVDSEPIRWEDEQGAPF